jgi:hypothetical protein
MPLIKCYKKWNKVQKAEVTPNKMETGPNDFTPKKMEMAPKLSYIPQNLNYRLYSGISPWAYF